MRPRIKVGTLVSSSNPLRFIQARRLEIKVLYREGIPNKILRTEVQSIRTAGYGVI
jgi:hypothetical protein